MTGQPTLDAHAVVLHVTSLILDAGILYENHTRGQHYVCFVQFSVKRQRRHHEGLIYSNIVESLLEKGATVCMHL